MSNRTPTSWHVAAEPARARCADNLQGRGCEVAMESLPGDIAAMSIAVAVEMIRPWLGTEREEEIADTLRSQLVVKWHQDPAKANGFITTLLSMVRDGTADRI